LRFGLAVGFVVVIALALFIYRIGSDVVATLPNLDEQKRPPVASQIFDYDNQLIGSVFFEDRIPVKISEVSKDFLNTIVTSEDERFYQHKGFDLRSIFRAFFVNIKTGSMSQGGSTLTQQVARSELFIDSKETSVTRKIKEIILAFKLEQRYTKEEILEAYVNQIFFGFGSYGVESAARNYFGKHAKDLNYAESSLLVAILPAPSVDNPIINLAGTKERQKNVLRKLVVNGVITEDESKKYFEVPYQRKSFREVGDNDSVNYFIDYVKAEMEKRYDPKDLKEGGLRIKTTLIRTYQKYAENAMRNVFAKAEKSGEFSSKVFDEFGVKQPQACFVAMNPRNGYILAMVGGRDYKNTKWNRTTAERHPGSSFKIFDYSAALENKSVTPASILKSDYNFNVNGWNPGEWSHSVTNKLYTVRGALLTSSNVCALRAGLRVGLDRVAYYAAKMGLKTPIMPYPSITVGSVEVRPVDMCTAYASLASGGIRHDPVAILEVQNRDGIIIERYQGTGFRVLSEETAWTLGNIFQDVLHSILGSTIKTPAAGKTGTSTGSLNAWYCCFTPEITVTCYVGKDSKKVMSAVNTIIWGSSMAAPMARDFVNACLTDKKHPLPKTPFLPAPKGMTGSLFCKTSGELINGFCPKDQIDSEYFFAGTTPDTPCQYHKQGVFPYNVVEEVIDGKKYYYKPGNSWCVTKEVLLSKDVYEKLPAKSDCPALINFTISDQSGQLLQEPYSFSKGGIYNLDVVIPQDVLGKFNEVDVYFGDMRVKRWQEGDLDSDTGQKIEFNSPLITTFAVSPDDTDKTKKLIFEIRGPNGFYLKKALDVGIN